jgi:hypothetical protein
MGEQETHLPSRLSQDTQTDVQSVDWSGICCFQYFLKKGPKFGHLEFKSGDVRGHHPIAHILEEFIS